MCSFLRTISLVLYGPNPAPNVYLTEHTSSPSDLSTVCALKVKSIPCLNPSSSSPADAGSALRCLKAMGMVSCQIKWSWARSLCWHWWFSDHSNHELSREMKMNPTKLAHWKITQIKINTNSSQPTHCMVTHMPVWAKEGLAVQLQISSIPQERNRQLGWAGTMPGDGSSDFDHFKSAVKHHEEPLTQATGTANSTVLLLGENWKKHLQQKKACHCI